MAFANCWRRGGSVFLYDVAPVRPIALQGRPSSFIDVQTDMGTSSCLSSVCHCPLTANPPCGCAVCTARFKSHSLNSGLAPGKFWRGTLIIHRRPPGGSRTGMETNCLKCRGRRWVLACSSLPLKQWPYVQLNIGRQWQES